MNHPPAPTAPPTAANGDATGHTAATCTHLHCDGCMFCDGGLWACTVCDGIEGSMPSTCPGERMTADERDAVYAGRLDYRDGRWFDGMASRFAPLTARAAAQAVQENV